MSSLRTFEIAVVSLPVATLMLVRIEPWVLEDASELRCIREGFARASHYPIVLVAREPCGCETMHGVAEHMRALARVSPGQLVWFGVAIDLGSPHPTLQRRPSARRRMVVN